MHGVCLGRIEACWGWETYCMLGVSGNIFAGLNAQGREEALETLLEGGEFRLERIVSTGQRTPEGEWYDQEADEWVVMLTGGARLRFEDGDAALELAPGDYLHIPAHRRHRVEWTDPEAPTVWLALHYRAREE